jgi:hypothetical protein
MGCSLPVKQANASSERLPACRMFTTEITGVPVGFNNDGNICLHAGTDAFDHSGGISLFDCSLDRTIEKRIATLEFVLTTCLYRNSGF